MMRLAGDQVIQASSFSHIRASPAEVWALIKPPESALLLDPTVVKAFRVPGTPEGVGEMQGFIAHRDGLEQVQLIEIVEEIPERLAVVRQIAGNYPTARLTYRLSPDAQGTTLEYELALTVSGIQARSASVIHEQHQLAAVTFLSRVKYILYILERDLSPRRGRHC